MRILIVDDDQASRSSLVKFLSRCGHQILESEDGSRAIRTIQKELVHLVISDIRMPGMDGHALLKTIKQEPVLNTIAVVLMTGYGDVKGAVDAMRHGAHDYLLKPIDPEELDAIVQRVAEYLQLRDENRRLTENFEARLQEETRDIRIELNNVRKAYAQVVGAAPLGIFSDALREVFRTAQRLHHHPDVPVLIEGETGTGKEVIARFIHYGGGEVTTPFIAMNCAAISANLFESELFGYEGGAFTGARPQGQKGKLQLAEDGSIFLDEIGEIPPDYQAKLLRVIQEREYYQVGGLKKLNTNARFICASNQDIRSRVATGHFREDLFFRLNVGYLRIPPLRDRREEILPLARMFLARLQEQQSTRFCTITPDAARLLQDHHWPGNVRELKSAMERVVLYWDEEAVQPKHLDFLDSPVGTAARAADHPPVSLDDIPLPVDELDLNEWVLNLVQRVLKKFHGNKSQAANFLKISRNTLYTYINRINGV